MADEREETPSRRRFLTGGFGAAALSLVAAEEALAKRPPTEANILGPYHRKGAPFR